MAAAEAIVVKEVSEEILQPLYTLESPAGDELADVLNRLFNKNPRQEAILRSLLVVAHAPDEQIHETRIVNTVAPHCFSTKPRARHLKEGLKLSFAMLWNSGVRHRRARKGF